MYNVYYLMRSYNITAGIPAFMIHMVRSEDSEKAAMPADGRPGNHVGRFPYTALQRYAQCLLGQNYKIIYQCNEILDDLENSGNKDDLENVRTKGEALFFRAYCFGTLYVPGEVPLVAFKVKKASDAMPAQSSCERDIRTDEQDLTETEKCLPLTWTSSIPDASPGSRPLCTPVPT